LPALENAAIRDQPVWKPVGERLHGDFLPNVRALFAPDNPQGVRVWELSAHWLKLLNGSRRLAPSSGKTPPLSLGMELGKRARERMVEHVGAVEAPLLQIEGLRCYGFSTGFAVVVADVALRNAAPSRTLLLEAVHGLARKHSLVWRETERVCASTTLGTLARGLLGRTDSRPSERVFTLVVAKVDGGCCDADEADRLALYLARHYTDDYQASEDAGESRFLGDFENVRHCMSNEGMATVVRVDDNAPEIVRKYDRYVSVPVHQKICLINFHAERALQQYLAHTVAGEDARPEAGKVAALERQFRELRHFEWYFFYPVVSRINFHNRLHRAIMDIKHLDEQHALVGRVTALYHAAMKEEQALRRFEDEKLKRRRMCWLTPLGAAAAGYLTVATIAREVVEAVRKEWLGEAEPMAVFLHHWEGSLALGVGLVAAAGIWLFLRRQCVRENHAFEEREHPVLELVESTHLNHLSRKRRKGNKH
jgi:hypothetical protein